jgi:ribosomal protein L37AE/L43A
MAEKKARTALKTVTGSVPECPECNSDLKVVRFAGAGETGLFWHCGKCSYKQRTGQ